MDTPDPAVAFGQTLAATLRHWARRDPGLELLAGALDPARFLTDPGGAGHMPPQGAGHLSAALDGLACDRPLADAVRGYVHTADWYLMLEGAEVDRSLHDGLLVGRPELPPDAGFRCGLFLIAPGVHYPLHQHGADEVYVPLSGTLHIQHGRYGTPFEVPVGSYSITPPNRLHALTTGDVPCLIAYVWTGDLAAPGWWWAEDGAGWHRTFWDRLDSGRWVRRATEPVGAAALAEIGEA